MAKWADYLISAVWFETKNNSKFISHVLLHADTENDFGSGIKTPKDEAIKLLKQGKGIMTIRWDYEQKTWKKGAPVTYETLNREEFLRTVHDTTRQDNLDNLIPASTFK